MTLHFIYNYNNSLYNNIFSTNTEIKTKQKIYTKIINNMIRIGLLHVVCELNGVIAGPNVIDKDACPKYTSKYQFPAKVYS